MIQLIINRLPTVIKSGTSVKLTRQNPMLTNSGDYTFDVQLPLSASENRAIFGQLQRLEKSLEEWNGKRLPALIHTDTMEIAGAVKVTNVTNEEVKVQFIAGRAELNDATKLDETYINRLSLGNCWDTFTEFTDGADSYAPGFNRQQMEYIFYRQPTVKNKTWTVKDMMWGTYGVTDTVLLPLYLEEEDVVINPYQFNSPTAEQTMLRVRDKYDPTNEYVEDSVLIAPMPYLIDIIKRVVAAIGYELRNFDLLNREPYNRLIIVSTQTADIARESVLPEWTVTEFFAEVENLLGLVFSIDEDGRSISVLKRTDLLDAEKFRPYELREVLDERSADISEDEEPVGTYDGNVVYDAGDEFPDILAPDSEVYEKAIVKEFGTYDALSAFFRSLSSQEKKKSPYILRDRSTGYEYAILREVTDTMYLEVVNVMTGTYTQTMKFDRYTDMVKWFREEDIDELQAQRWLLKVRKTGTLYTVAGQGTESELWTLRRVAQYGGLWRNTKDYSSATKLRIVPARMAYIHKAHIRNEEETLTTYGRLVTPDDPNAVPVLSTNQSLRLQRYEYSVDRALNPDRYHYEEEESENGSDNAPDYLQLAYFNPENTYNGLWIIDSTEAGSVNRRMPIALGMTYGENIRTGQYDHLEPDTVTITDLTLDGFFSLKGDHSLYDTAEPSPNVGQNVGRLIKEMNTVVSAVEHSIDFIANGENDPRRVFYIRGKKYLCKKFEVTFSDDREEPIRRGFFLELT